MENEYEISPGTIMSLYGNSSIDQMLKLTTSFFGASPSFVPTDFIYNPPKDPRHQDLRMTCPITGYSGPKSEFVNCDGIWVLGPWAITNVNK
jgi:hypothetical protein